ncbi:DUF3592 domain-containing protein [Scatolibacter rhodanostii]|uniref:DUF3592 domain-containing protein n=1 Tax=Scatolibacter rhodanostii TaxID=2014781 RepID=UPI000C081E84|nr:DUF3592 domain-containing protein [Scatolibacter rhodanostii]
MDKASLNRMQKIMGIAFSCIGAVMFVVAVVVYATFSQMKARSVLIEGEVTDFSDRESYTVVEYDWKDQHYERKLAFFSSSYNVGDKINLYIDPLRPRRVEGEMKYWILMLTFGVLGVVFLGVGIAFLLSIFLLKNKQEKLLQKGKKILAEIEEITYNRAMRINRHHPYVIVCAWKNPENGVTYHFRGPNMWDDPTFILEKKGIKKLPVYFDERNIKNYIVSLDVIIAEDGKNVFL